MTDNVRTGLKMYCGSKEVLPPLTYRGTTLACFQKGIGVGRYIQKQIDNKIRRQERQRVEAISSVLTRRKIAKDIETKGLNSLKQEIRIGTLPIGMLKALAQRLTGTTQPIPQYGKQNRQELIVQLQQRGFMV